jgi:hypothetical protein
LKGTSWLTSVRPLMMRLSATLTRRNSAGASTAAAGGGCRNPFGGKVVTVSAEGNESSVPATIPCCCNIVNLLY